jgi:succinate dehydrogenase / fumarate reductase, cytochrome b subunit
MAERPLSPHVTVYKWAYTMTLSILHRVSGIALFGALIVMIVWLMAAARGPLSYAETMSTLASAPFKCLIAIALLALCYHFCNGLRHLAWDAGWGFERVQARRSAVIVVIVTLLAFALCIYYLAQSGVGAA